MPEPAVARASPAERLLWGDALLSNAELLELVVGTDAAHELQSHYSTLAELEVASSAELATLPSLTLERAAALVAAHELAHRRAHERAHRGTPIANAEVAYNLLAPLFHGETREVFLVLALDTKCCLLCPPITIAIGTISTVIVHPREVFRPLIRVAASSCLLAHLHPSSGQPVPSPDDILLTTRLKQAGELLGIPVHDHLVIGDQRWLSMAERNLI
jgi:DNA repair protein RadC